MNLNNIKVTNSLIQKDDKFNIPYPYVGTLDLETYDNNDKSKVYAIGFYTKQFRVNNFYIDENTLNSD